MTYLFQIFVFYELGNLFRVQRRVALGEDTELRQLDILDIVPVFLRKQILVNPVSAALRENDAPVRVPVQALLEDPAAEIIGLAPHDVTERFAQLVVSDASLPRRFGKPSGFKSPRGFLNVMHKLKVALSATEINAGLARRVGVSHRSHRSSPTGLPCPTPQWRPGAA
jgi:hypothetical protein